MIMAMNGEFTSNFLYLRRPSYPSLLATLIFLIAIVLVAVIYLDETKELLLLLKNSDPGWMIIAVLTQIPTYIFTGIVWHLSAQAVNYNLTLQSLTELALEPLSVSQIIPSGG